MSSDTKAPTEKQKLKEQITKGSDKAVATASARTALVFFELDNKEAGIVHELMDAVKELGVDVVAEKTPGDELKASDVAVVFSKKMLEAAREAAAVPVAQQNGASTVDYNPLAEKGNGFYFKRDNKWEVFAAIVRALETYKFPYDWDNVVKAMKKKQ
ncbi:hypothetical protein KBD59_04195 [Candidatus Gracilibacteria bacterium]|nr:hypothetical protein [Candidatus Gracilibacteria bacterium]